MKKFVAIMVGLLLLSTALPVYADSLNDLGEFVQTRT